MPRPRPEAAPAASRARRAGGERISLSESGGVRYLHFGSPWVQGAMRVTRPFALELEYQRQMMVPLLLLPVPECIVQLGLGAAALTKYCWRELPRTRIEVVELSEAVVQTAHRWFRLPDDERIEVTLGDAAATIAAPAWHARADWLQVDLYDAAARGPVHDDVDFYRACRRVLRSPGVAVFNLFGRRCEPSLAAIGTAFDGRVLSLPEAEAGNRVVLALVGSLPPVTLAALEQRAAGVESDLRLPAGRWLSSLRDGLAADGLLQA